jgi:hypothetical protein
MPKTQEKGKEWLDFNIRAFPPIERKADGILPQMTPRQRQAAARLIRKACCNCYNGNCVLLDDGEGVVCPQSISLSVTCKFFRYVLLDDMEGLALKAELFRNEALKHCSVCGRAFQSKSNNAKYCKPCAIVVQRKQKAEHIRRKRADVEK